MGLFTRKHWTDKLDLDETIRAQARARFDRRVAAGNAPDVAKRIVTAWAKQEQIKLDMARDNDPWRIEA